MQKHSKGAGVFGDDIICKSRVGPGLREKTFAVHSFVVGKVGKKDNQRCLLSTTISGFARKGSN